MKKITDIISAKPWVGWLLYFLTIVIVFLIALFGSSIIERRSEANLIVQNVKPIADWEPRNDVWEKITQENLKLINQRLTRVL